MTATRKLVELTSLRNSDYSAGTYVPCYECLGEAFGKVLGGQEWDMLTNVVVPP